MKDAKARRDALAAMLAASGPVADLSSLSAEDLATLRAAVGATQSKLIRHVVRVSGEYLSPWLQGFAQSGAATTDVVDTVYAAFFKASNPFTAISTYIHTAVAGTLGKMALFKAEGPGLLPKTRIAGFDVGVDCNVTGIKDFALAGTFNPETDAPDGYWVLFVANGATIRRASSGTNSNNWISDSDMTAASAVTVRLTAPMTFATPWPADISGWSWTVQATGAPGVIAIKAA